jgi:Uma2 family endonuclease
MTILATRSPITDGDPPPVEHLYRLTAEQFRLADVAGVFPVEHRVRLVDGILRSSGAVYRLGQEQYRRMNEVDSLTKDDRVELLGGWLVPKMPSGPPHRVSTQAARAAIDEILPKGWFTAEEKAIALPLTRSEPEPDVQVTRGHFRDYARRHPGPEDIGMVVEVSSSSIAIDQGFKLRLYGREGIPAYWIVNLITMMLEVYTVPSGPADEPGYRHRQDFGPESEVPLVLDGREVGRIAVRDLLP